MASIWSPIIFGNEWENLDTSPVDNLFNAWIRYRSVAGQSKALSQYMERLKRIHAIETGVIENLYSVSRGVTEILINEGFKEALIQHNDSDVGAVKLLAFIRDNEEAINFVFDVVKSERPISESFIKELHQLVTRNQEFIDTQDHDGKPAKVKLLRGEYKKWPNNPKRLDGTVFHYCPPDFVVDEMQNLLRIYQEKQDANTHPVILAAWFHHAFTLIHPFMDGNGRLSRLLATLILIKGNYFPFTIQREQKADYIDALETADSGNPQPFVTLISKNQRLSIEEALNLPTEKPETISLLADAIAKRIAANKTTTQNRINALKQSNKDVIVNTIKDSLNLVKLNLEKTPELPFKVTDIRYSSFNLEYYNGHTSEYAIKHGYHFKQNENSEFIGLSILWDKVELYKIVFTCHYFGQKDDLWAVGSFMEIFTPGSELLFKEAGSSNYSELVLSPNKPLQIDLLVQSVSPGQKAEIQTTVNQTVAHFMSVILYRIG